MDKLNQMLVFAKVAETLSFSVAARQLGVGKSAISMAVTRLEQSLGARLLHRTTRQLSLTEAGHRYNRFCANIADELASADEQVRTLSSGICGSIRITSPAGFGNRVLIPAAQRFMSLYPDVSLDLILEDRNLNLVEHEIDVALRIANLSDSELIARPLIQVPLVLCASPDFLKRHGTPASPEDLNDIPWVMFSHLPERLEHEHAGVRYVVQPRGKIRVNNEQARLQLVLDGAGLTLAPMYEVWDGIASGELTVIDFGFPLPATPITALYLNRRFLPRKIEVFIEFFQQYLSEMPWIRK